MSTARVRGSKDVRAWQYHSRSDHHSKVACVGVLMDLLVASALLREQVASGKVVIGINHPMRDFVNNKRKNLDLVIARPASAHAESGSRTLRDLVHQWGVNLDDEQGRALAALPEAAEGPVGSVLLAMEAKACMTEHAKAGPRLYDELNSSHGIVHASSNQALAVGFVMINAAATFISPDRNRNPGSPVVVTRHKQPHAAEVAIRAIAQLPRRSETTARGYDGLGIVVVDAANDGSPVRIVTQPPAPQPGDNMHYESMLRRVTGEYDATFRRI